MRILCIGDSNTWGYNPENGQRFTGRWTKVLASLMPEHDIIEEGLNGRTLLSEDPYIKERLGIASLKMLLLSHRPVDVVVIMLGTNDLKSFFPCSVDYIAKGIAQFIEVTFEPMIWERFTVPKLLVVSPVHIREDVVKNGGAFGEFDMESVVQSKQMAPAIEAVCAKYGVNFMDAAKFAEASLIDGVHMDEENHAKLACVIAEKLNAIS